MINYMCAIERQAYQKHNPESPVTPLTNQNTM